MPRSKKRQPKNSASRSVCTLPQILQSFRQGDFGTVIRQCGLLLEGEPRNVDALNLLGGAHMQAGNAGSAIDALSRAALLKPRDPMIEANLGSVLATAKRFEDARLHLTKALAQSPEDIEILANLARVELELEHFAEATALFATVLRHAPNEIGILTDAIRAAVLAGETAKAKQYASRATSLDVWELAAQRQLTRVLYEHGLYAESLAAANGALDQNSDDVQAHIAKGVVLSRLQRPDDALASFDEAIRREPDNADAVLWRGFHNLSVGRFRAGWADYRARQTQRSADAPNSLAACGAGYTDKPLPENLEGATVLVDRDQGLGDEIFFLRYLAALRNLGATVTYRSDVRLNAMLRRAEIADFVVAKVPSEVSYDYIVSVCDLPRLLPSDEDTKVPPSIGIPPLPDQTAKIGAQLTAFGSGPYVGVTWRAGTQDNNRFLHKEVPAERLAAALSGTDGTIVVLQRNPAEGEIEAFSRALGRPVLDLSKLNTDLEAMLCLVSLLDAYVGVSNTNIHLREACGLSSHVLIPYPPEFRWMASGAESPWFPGSPLYRQCVDGDWTDALSQLSNALDHNETDTQVAV